MGIPRFFRWIGERYPCLSQVVKQYQIPDFDNLYLDVNGIIHTCSHPDDDNPHFRITEEKIFADICRYIEFLFTMIKPQKVFFIAVDGVAPRAKMNQQRGRRFKSAKAAADQEAAAQKRGEKLPDTERFDSNCITPGTEFMARLDSVLNHFIQYKISTDPNWQSVSVYYSSHSVPGEGEHKIMDFLRYQRSLPTYNPETRHCLYGLDTDLIMLGLVTHEPHFSLLREEILFKKSAKRPTCPEQTTFFLLHLRLFREYLEFEFRDLGLSFGYDIERIIDDWVLIEFLIGNDFIPHVPDCHVVSNDLPELWRIYKEVLPTLDGYLNEHGRLSLPRFQRFIQALSGFDRRKFESRYDDIKYMAGKKAQSREANGVSNGNGSPEEESSSAHLMSSNEMKLMKQLMPFYSAEDDIGDGNLSGGEDGAQLMPDPSRSPPMGDDEDDESVDEEVEEDMAFRSYKRDYYRSKMQLSGEKPMRTADFVRLQVASYIEALEWTLRYYYEGVPSWSWFYPFHYAPYLSDITNISNMELNFKLGIPFHPFEQLMSVLPSASRKLLPGPYRSLMTDATSSIRHFYPEDFATDLNGKQLDWEAVVLIPFIEEQQLLSAIRPLEQTLTPAEADRNAFGTINCFRFSGDTNGTLVESSLSFIPKHTNCAIKEKIPWDKFHLDPSQVSREYPKSSLQSLVYAPNFPTFKHLPCDSSLYAAGTQVFKMASRNLNMIVKVSESIIPTVEAIDSVAANQIGSIVLVNWPFLTEARIISIYTPGKYYTTNTTDYSAAEFEVTESVHTSDSARIYEADIGFIRRYFYNTHGLDFRNAKCLVYAVTLTGVKYSENSNNQLTAVKLWSTTPQPYPYDGVLFNLKDVAAANSLLAAPPVSVMTTKLGELFPLGENLFVVSDNYFGRMGMVLGYDERRNSVKVRIRMTKQPKFDDLIEQLRAGTAGIVYNQSHLVARQAGVSSFFLSRLTGCIRIKKERVIGDNGDIVKVNVGLDLKHTKENLRTPGYTLREEQGSWLYSNAVADLVRQYKAKFPQMLRRLQELVEGNAPDPYAYSDVFPDAPDNNQLDHVREFLLSLPTAKLTPVPNDSFILEEELVREVDKYIIKRAQSQYAEVFLKPDYLYRPKLTNRVNLSTDHFGNGNGHHFNLLDRVINIAPSHSVPLGLEGTVIGVLEETNTSSAYEEKPDKNAPKKVTYEVMFDAEFQHGQMIRCPEKRGYRMFPQNLLGIRRTIANSKQVQNYVSEVATRTREVEKKGARPYADVVVNAKQPNNAAGNGNPLDPNAFWKAVGGKTPGEEATKKTDSNPWPLVPANLLNEQGAKQKGAASGNKKQRAQTVENNNVIPIPPRLLLKTPNGVSENNNGNSDSLKQILKNIGVPDVAPVVRAAPPHGKIASVPVIGGSVSAVAPSLPGKQPKQQHEEEQWEPKDLPPHDWDRIMSGAGIKVTALPGPAQPNKAESPKKTRLPKSASGTVRQPTVSESSSRGPLRERQTSTSGVSGHQLLKLFNGAPGGGETATFVVKSSSSSSSEDGIMSPVAMKKPPKEDTKTPSKQQQPQPHVGDEVRIINLQRDLANLKAGKPVEFATSSPEDSPIVLSPSKSSVTNTPQRIDANHLLASVASAESAAKSKAPKQTEQQHREDHVEKLAVWADRNGLKVRYESNIVMLDTGSKCKFNATTIFTAKSRDVNVAVPRPVEGQPGNSEHEAKQSAAKLALTQFGNNGSHRSPRRPEHNGSPRKEVDNGKKMNANAMSFVPLQVMKNMTTGRNGTSNGNAGVPPIAASVPMFGPPAPPPSALPIPVTVAGSFFPSPQADSMQPRNTSNLLASLMSPSGVKVIPQTILGSYESPSAFSRPIPTAVSTATALGRPFDLNSLFLAGQQQQQAAAMPVEVQQAPVLLPPTMPVQMSTSMPVMPVITTMQQAIPLSFFLPTVSNQPVTGNGAVPIQQIPVAAILPTAQMPSPSVAATTTTPVATTSNSPPAEGSSATKPRVPRLAARFGCPAPAATTASSTASN